MHELSIAQSVIVLAEGACSGRRIGKVTVEIGALAGVAGDALAFCFDLATQGTLAEGAALEMRRVEGLAECESCGATFPAASHLPLCGCGSWKAHLVRGEELRLSSIELL